MATQSQLFGSSLRGGLKEKDAGQRRKPLRLSPRGALLRQQGARLFTEQGREQLGNPSARPGRETEAPGDAPGLGSGAGTRGSHPPERAAPGIGRDERLKHRVASLCTDPTPGREPEVLPEVSLAGLGNSDGLIHGCYFHNFQ